MSLSMVIPVVKCLEREFTVNLPEESELEGWKQTLLSDKKDNNSWKSLTQASFSYLLNETNLDKWDVHSL